MPSTTLLENLKPIPFNNGLIRIGSSQDGGYLSPDDLQGLQACFSPGAENRKTFEDDLSLNHNIPCHICDFSSNYDSFQTPLIPGLQTFEKAWLSSHTSQTSIRLQDWVKLRAPGTSDLILQLDIEGGEYEILEASSQELLNRFRVIIIELHDLDKILLNPQNNEREVKALKKLFASHICVHAHPNNCCGETLDPFSKMNIPNTLEVTLLRKDRLRDIRFSQKKNIKYHLLPHPLDIARSVKHHPPIHLNSFWINKRLKRHPLSHLRIAADWIDFSIKKPIYTGLRTKLRKLLKIHQQ